MSLDQLNTPGGHILVFLMLIIAGIVGHCFNVPQSDTLLTTCIPLLLYAMKPASNGNGNGNGNGNAH